MLLNIFIVLAFIGILSGLSKLLKEKIPDLDNTDNELVKCSSCGDYLSKSLGKLDNGEWRCRHCSV